MDCAKCRNFKRKMIVFEIKLIKLIPTFLGFVTNMIFPKLLNTTEVIFVHINRDRTVQFKLWAENIKLVLRKKPAVLPRKRRKEIHLPYLEAVAITFLPDKQSGFLQFIQGKLDFTSDWTLLIKTEILTKLQPDYVNRVNLITGRTSIPSTWVSGWTVTIKPHFHTHT
jgi:peptide/nickel transport system substrate-binding protein